MNINLSLIELADLKGKMEQEYMNGASSVEMFIEIDGAEPAEIGFYSDDERTVVLIKEI